jgi:hypothetical protein
MKEAKAMEKVRAEQKLSYQDAVHAVKTVQRPLQKPLVSVDLSNSNRQMGSPLTPNITRQTKIQGILSPRVKEMSTLTEAKEAACQTCAETELITHPSKFNLEDITTIAMAVLEVVQTIQSADKTMAFSQSLVSTISKKVINATRSPTQPLEVISESLVTNTDHSSKSLSMWPKPLIGRTRNLSPPQNSISSTELSKQSVDTKTKLRHHEMALPKKDLAKTSSLVKVSQPMKTTATTKQPSPPISPRFKNKIGKGIPTSCP